MIDNSRSLKTAGSYLHGDSIVYLQFEDGTAAQNDDGASAPYLATSPCEIDR